MKLNPRNKIAKKLLKKTKKNHVQQLKSQLFSGPKLVIFEHPLITGRY